MAGKIRTGLIRCDTHGLWFGPIMAEHDAKLFQRPQDPSKPVTYTWQAGGCHQFFYTRYSDPLHMTAPFVGGFEITKLWDAHREAAEQAAAVFKGVPKICDTPDQCCEDVDLVLIADCNYDGADHLELARPALENGIPTFVDKPFAHTVEDCRTMIELADKHDCPILSMSILRVEPAITWFKNRLPEVGEPNMLTWQGYGTHPAGLVHTTQATQHMFGRGIRTVQALKTPKHTNVFLDYEDNPSAPSKGVFIHTDVGHRPFTALAGSVYGTRDDIHALILGDYQYPNGTAAIVRQIKQMVQIHQASRDIVEDMVEAIAVIQAFQKSENTGRPERVDQFL